MWVQITESEGKEGRGEEVVLRRLGIGIKEWVPYPSHKHPTHKCLTTYSKSYRQY
jgi:hypothetical protein